MLSLQEHDIQSSLHPVLILDKPEDLSIFLKSQNLRPATSLVVTDTEIDQTLQCQSLKPFPKHFLPTGETAKSLEALDDLYKALYSNGINRQGALITFGGGSINDVSGLAASTYLRGIKLIHIPTTLLSMVDSAIGGKNAINFCSSKNQIGTIYQPAAVAVCPAYLKTLPKRAFNMGMAEVIKYSLLSSSNLFEKLIHSPLLNANASELREIIEACIKIKLSITETDPNEAQLSSPRMLLNLGHTFAHAIEAVDNNHNYWHGEAVSIGLMMALRLSQKLNLLTDATLPQKLQQLLSQYDLPVMLDKELPVPLLQQHIKKDKKAVHGLIQFILINKVGDVFPYMDVSDELVIETWLEAGASLS